MEKSSKDKAYEQLDLDQWMNGSDQSDEKVNEPAFSDAQRAAFEALIDEQADGRAALFVKPAKLQSKPADSRWTDEQWQAIVDGERNILVAAAAGSGKTAVLVERIIRKISNVLEPVHVDELLVATFTKAAAAEMRERIRLALEKELSLAPDSEHLARQLALLNRASITTLHSFCLEVIQRYFQTIELDPSFRVANETETEVLRQDVLAELFEEKYAAEEELFHRLVDWFSGERNDDAAFRLIQRLYDFSRSHPWPKEWLSEMAGAFEAHSVEQLSNTPWAQSIMQDAKLTIHAVVQLLRQASRLTTAPGGPEPYRETLQSELQAAIQLQDKAESLVWHEMSPHMEGLTFGRLPACRGDQYEKSLQEEVKGLRDQAKVRFNKLREELFSRAPEQFLQELHRMAPLMGELVGLVVAFGSRYENAKREKGLLDFSDLEHYCLRILRTPDSSPEEIRPSEAALQYQLQFKEILLDEYQDTNMVQEAIVALISRQPIGNRFMVGDVKQSIYRFRLAEPGLFLQKYEAYQSDRHIQADGTRIDLARNFRSRRQIVDAVNMLFRQLMNKQVTELDYDQAAELQFGASYFPELPETEDSKGRLAAELILIEKGQGGSVYDLDGEAASDDDSENESSEESSSNDLLNAAEMETARLEARAIAARIRQMLGDEGGKPYQVFDGKGGLRAATYKDMVILLRATQAWAPLMVEELRLEGIPAYAEFSTGYFQATEVEVMVSLLRVIDNPYQDIPLAGVLRSPIIGLSAEELAQVRLFGPKLPFYDALRRACEDPSAQPTTSLGLLSTNPVPDAGMGDYPLSSFSGTKTEEGARDQNGPSLSQETILRLKHFLERLERWRDEARQGSLSELIWSIYRETGYYEWIGGVAGGHQRQANLRALYDRACQYESSSVQGLYRFLRFVDRMKETGGDLGTARALGEQEDVVRIMTIHKSKGLEFPVVFVAGLAKLFNQQDIHAPFLMHKQLGFGPRYVDEDTRVTYPTLGNLAIRRQMRLELLAEELRVLYVALTRPKEKLILIGTVSDAEKAIQRYGEALDIESLLLPDYLIARARSYLDWIGPAVIRLAAASEWRKLAGLPNRNGACLMDDPSEWKLTLMPASIIGSIHDLPEHSPAEDDTDRTERLERLVRVEKLEEEGVAPDRYWNYIDERLSWRNPYRIAELLPAKTTVTEMKRLFASDDLPSSNWVETPPSEAQSMEQDESEAARLLEDQAKFNADSTGSFMPEVPSYVEQHAETGQAASCESPSFAPKHDFTLRLRRPRFMEKQKLTPAERGTAYHLLMQHLPLKQGLTIDTIKDTLARLVSKEIMTEAQAQAIDAASVHAFFEDTIGKQLIEAAWAKRELPFSFGLTAAEAYAIELQQDTDTGEQLRFVATPTFAAKDESGLLDQETVLVQGVIDCLFEWDGKLILLDFKTDKVLAHRGGTKALVDHYRFQLDLYSRAIEKIWGRPVDQKVLYFFEARQSFVL